MTPQLFTPLRLRGLELRNRIVVSPMCQYSAVEGVIQGWHLAHHARFALGGDRGRRLVEDADEWMRAQSIRRPECVARVLAPGFA